MARALVMSALDPETGQEGYIWLYPPLLRRRLGEGAAADPAAGAMQSRGRSSNDHPSSNPVMQDHDE